MNCFIIAWHDLRLVPNGVSMNDSRSHLMNTALSAFNRLFLKQRW